MTLFVQVEDFLKAFAVRRPVAVLLDDLHWADAGSLDLLRFLAHALSGMPLLVLLTYRSDEVTHRHPLYQLLPMLRREPTTVDLHLGPLDDRAVRSLIGARYELSDADSGRLALYLAEHAEGNPLFVGELLRSLEEIGAARYVDDVWALGSLDDTGVPPALGQVIDARVARLGEGTRRLLAIAAVIGHTVPLDLLTAVAEADEEALHDVIEQGLEAQLLVDRQGGVQVRFAHALIREALYESMPAVRRRRIHRRVAESLVATSDPDPDAVANHFQRAGDERALPWLLHAGERAQAAYAWTTAAQRFEAAAALLGRNEQDAAERGGSCCGLPGSSGMPRCCVITQKGG